MEKRLKSIKRVIAVQEQLRRLAEGKLADLERREANLVSSRREIVASLNEDQALHGLFLEARARRVTSLSKDIASLGRAKEAQAKHLREETGRLKRAERIADELGREHQVALDRKELGELVDRLAAQGATQAAIEAAALEAAALETAAALKAATSAADATAEPRRSEPGAAAEGGEEPSASLSSAQPPPASLR
jgi:hypothetical protein